MTPPTQRKPEQPPRRRPPCPAPTKGKVLVCRGRVVSCYNCERSVRLDGTHQQRCPSCHVVLAPAPAWALAAGWPERSIPQAARKRLRYKNAVAVKKLYFRTDAEHALRQRLEALSQLQRISMNDAILSLIEDGLKHRAEARS